MDNQNSRKIEQLADRLRNDINKDYLNLLVKELEQGTLYVPAAIPPGTDPALIRQLISGSGMEQGIPEGFSPRPAVLQNAEGRRYLPVFTTQKQAEKGDQQFPLLLTMPFTSCLDLVAADGGISGVILNAFDQNIPLNTKVNRKANGNGGQSAPLTETQLHAMARQRVEAELLPKALFAGKTDMVERLRKDCATELLKLYEQAYPKEIGCPYTEDDFDLLSINARENLSVIRITMPSSHMYAGICPVILLRFNPQTEDLQYFAVVKGDEPGEMHLFEAWPDGTNRDCGEAPEEGSELQFMIDYSAE